MSERDWAAEAREALARAADPLREQLVEVEQEIHDAEVRIKGLIEARRFLKSQINRLVPSEKLGRPKKKPSTKPVTQERLDREAEGYGLVTKHLTEHAADYKDGLTAAQVHRAISASNGSGTIGPSRVLRIIEDLHETGFLRADRKVRGGAMQYKLVERP